MALNKVNYVDGQTVITAENLNDIQDSIIALENAPAQGLTEDMKQALLQLARKVAYIDDQGQTYYDDLYDALYPPKTVVLITAVFEQGSTVIYDDTALNDLKQYLTVTAKYDDNSTAILPDAAYTLSGLLEAGTSTVTVLYNGLTTTFTVNVTARPTLSSISAVYTQSGTVYDTDTLDSLKADLVVTAHYSDSSTATVAADAYTLSGELTAGTSTITASYGGKTATFDVAVTHYIEGWYYPFNGSILSAGTKDFGLVGNEVYTEGLFGRQAYSHIIPTPGDSTTDTQMCLSAINLTEFPNPGADFTFSLWLKLQTANVTTNVVFATKYNSSTITPSAKYFANGSAKVSGWSVSVTGYNGNAQAGFALQFLTNRQLVFRLSNIDLTVTGNLLLTYPSTFDPTSWHHYAVTRKNNTFSFFADGVLICTASANASTVYAANQVAVGGRFATNDSVPSSDVINVSYGELIQDLFIANYCKWESAFDPQNIVY